MRRPFVVAEPAVGGPGRQDQVVVFELARFPDRDHAPCRIDAGDFAHDDGGFATAPQHGAHRARDVGRRQRRGRGLIQQRLEDVMVGAVDQQDVDVTSGQSAAPR